MLCTLLSLCLARVSASMLSGSQDRSTFLQDVLSSSASQNSCKVSAASCLRLLCSLCHSASVPRFNEK